MKRFLSMGFESPRYELPVDSQLIDGSRPTAVLELQDGTGRQWTARLLFSNHTWTEEYSPAGRPQEIVDTVGEWEARWMR